MEGLRERKRRKTFKAIHDAAMRLFAERGYHAVTVAEIADEAEVSRATVFAYYPAKEDIVLGEAPLALESLRAALAEASAATPVVETVRAWIGTLVGWVEPDILLQRQIADEVPAVAAARSRMQRDVEAILAEALAQQMGDAERLAPQLVAGSLASALAVVEHEATQRMADRGKALTTEEVDDLFDAAVAFIDGGLERLRARQT